MQPLAGTNSNPLLFHVKQNPLCVQLPGHPPSVNHRVRFSRHGGYKTEKAELWESHGIYLVRKAAHTLWNTHDLSTLSGLGLELEISVVRPLWTGRTKAKRSLYVRPDVSNFIKSAEDVVMTALGLEDAAVVNLLAKKVEAQGPDHTLIALRFL